MSWLERPVSASELERMFEEPEHHYLSILSYHLGRLAKHGAVEKTGCRQVRGVRETFYALLPAVIKGAEAGIP
jgi:hypothetical protein